MCQETLPSLFSDSLAFLHGEMSNFISTLWGLFELCCNESGPCTMTSSHNLGYSSSPFVDLLYLLDFTTMFMRLWPNNERHKYDDFSKNTVASHHFLMLLPAAEESPASYISNVFIQVEFKDFNLLHCWRSSACNV